MQGGSSSQQVSLHLFHAQQPDCVDLTQKKLHMFIDSASRFNDSAKAWNLVGGASELTCLRYPANIDVLSCLEDAQGRCCGKVAASLIRQAFPDVRLSEDDCTFVLGKLRANAPHLLGEAYSHARTCPALTSNPLAQCARTAGARSRRAQVQSWPSFCIVDSGFNAMYGHAAPAPAP